ncbi:helix-turn-helix domain-containing protein [Thiocapsa sp.]|uniref:helix-turn-helix domain-containing protein n=1 Tax=Thiocapsa sp. TaxID=2024551 RepID=UPI00262F85A4|nr:helix-turn-helix domain-containing protein [Thiocapsa sp.]
MTRRTRLEQAEHIAAAEARLAAGETQRAVATEMGIARSTLRDWCGEVPRGDPPTGLTAFARTPEGSIGCIGWCWRRISASPCGRRAEPGW